jgi:hypothetical protein
LIKNILEDFDVLIFLGVKVCGLTQCNLLSSHVKLSTTLNSQSQYFKGNMVQMLCTYICKWKKISVETIPGMGKGDYEGNSGGGAFTYNIFDIL